MKSYKLNIGVIISAVGIFSLVLFSVILIMFHILTVDSVTNILLDYSYIIAPTSILWISIDKYFWHTPIFQSLKKSVNIPPDLRGRWEGALENEDGSQAQKFVVEIRQTLTTLNVYSYTSFGRSVSILPDIAISEEDEDIFTLCYLWKGNVNTSIKDIHHAEQFQGYTMLSLYTHEKPKYLKGFYFANRLSTQSRGGIQAKWVSKELKHQLD